MSLKNRRTFLKETTILTGLLATTSYQGVANTFCEGFYSSSQSKLKLRFKPYILELAHTFTVSGNSRTSTPVVLTEIEYNGVIGYGEASMPPYLGESQESVIAFLSKVNLEQFDDPFQIEKILHYVDALEPLNKAAKASVDIALHDLVGKILGKPWHQIWGLDGQKTLFTSYTVGIDTPDIVRKKTQEAAPYKIIKVKLGRETDKQMIETIREVTDKPICVDVNQGWKDRNHALEMAHWLKEKGVIFIEQAMPKEDVDGNAWLTEHSPLPTIGDEAVQRLGDVSKAHKVYSGINIKLMKCTGLREAHKMITLARALDMKVMIGCMTETSCAISAMAQLAPLADFADLDGNLLIKNDCFEGMKIVDGKISLNQWAGIGVKKLS